MKQAFNPYMPLHECVPDAEPHVFDGRVYVYGSHDKEGGDKFCMLDYVTYSAPVDNLRDWRYEGVIYKAENDPLYSKFPYMYAPDVVRGNDGKYYLYYSMSSAVYPSCSFVMSVAVSDTPYGEFKYLGYVRNKDGSVYNKYLIFDPGVLNDNGTIRLYYGMWHNWNENPSFTREQSIQRQMLEYQKPREEIENTPDGVMGPIMVELEDDMLTVKSTPKRIFPPVYKGTEFEGHEFFEASSMRKVGEKYYFIYSTYNGHELAYATSDYPDRDFKYRGVIISNGDIGYNGRKPQDRLTRTGNNHGSIENINGEWYIFYHRQTRKNEFSRQACAEKIKILPDGTIPQVQITSCGLNGGPLVAEGSYPAPISCNLTNGHLPHGISENIRYPHITSRGEDRYIAEIENDTLIGYKYFNFENVKKIGVSYRSGDAVPNGVFEIKLSENSEAIGKIEIKDAPNYIKVAADVNINGTYPLYFIYKGEGSVEINEIYFEK